MEAVTLQHFAPLLGQRFELQPGEGEPLPAELVEAMPLGAATGPGRAPFSLVFRGPPQPVLPQRIYRLAHQADALTPMDIFIVPLRANADGVLYEAVFA